MIIRFKQWKEYQFRGEVKSPSWFKIENKIFFNSVWGELDSEEFKCFIFLLCQASINNNRGEFHYSTRMHDRMSGIDEKVFHRTFKKLKQLQIIEMRTLHGRYTHVADTIANVTLEENRREEKRVYIADFANQQDVISFDFDALYQRYPRKEGKAQGLLQCKKQIKTQEDYDSLLRAIERYSAHCSKTDQIRKHFSSFMGSEKTGYFWRDWLDPQTGTTVKAETNKVSIADLLRDKK